MSTLLCNRGTLIVTSGLKFKVIESQFFEDSTRDGVERELPDALPVKNGDGDGDGEDPKESKNKTAESEVPRTILGGNVSPDGCLLALCDDRKQLTLWKCEDWSLVNQWTLQRRANKVVFNSDATAILLADKGGDVFRFDLNDNSSFCLLGHLSMLLDVTLSACGNYVITCDRDEKIRVSHYPNAYNIHNFCLGHTEFVTGIALCPHNPSFLCSVSGDGTIRVWDFLNGLQLGSKVCSEDVSDLIQSMPENDRIETPSNGSSRNEFVTPRVKRSPIPAVKSLKCKQLSENESLIIVTIERFDGLLAYKVTGTDATLTFLQIISTPNPVWDYGFDQTSGDLIVLLFSDQDYIKRYKVSTTELSEVTIQSSVQTKSELDRFFEAAKSRPRSNVDDLYKKAFDTMNEYMERKETRINKKASSVDSGLEPKKIKL